MNDFFEHGDSLRRWVRVFVYPVSPSLPKPYADSRELDV
jgi:hypothetical protein